MITYIRTDQDLYFTFLLPSILHVRIQRKGTGGRTLPENYKNAGFPSNARPDPLKITKLPSQHSMLGHHRPACETLFKWCFAGGPMMVRLWWYIVFGLTFPSSTKKNVVKVGPTLSGPAYDSMQPNINLLLPRLAI